MQFIPLGLLGIDVFFFLSWRFLRAVASRTTLWSFELSWVSRCSFHLHPSSNGGPWYFEACGHRPFFWDIPIHTNIQLVFEDVFASAVYVFGILPHDANVLQGSWKLSPFGTGCRRGASW